MLMKKISSLTIAMYILGVILFMGLYSCDPSSPKAPALAAENTPPISTTSANSNMVMLSGEGIPQEDVVKIATECTHIDFTFNELPISMNQSEKSAIIGDLSYISPETVAEISNDCKPLARKVYWGPKGVIIEADIYFSKDCLYFVFIRNEKRLFANKMNQNGITFYNGVLSQVQGGAPQ